MPRSPPLSLSEAVPDEDYRISRFLFGMVRDRCWSLGIREGSTIRFRDRSRESVRLELADGRTVALEGPYARFVELAPGDGTAAVASDP